MGHIAQLRNQFKLVLIVTGTVTDVPPNIPPFLNGSHSFFLVDYKIYIEYIYYK